jgi:hypothetical protein
MGKEYWSWFSFLTFGAAVPHIVTGDTSAFHFLTMSSVGAGVHSILSAIEGKW